MKKIVKFNSCHKNLWLLVVKNKFKIIVCGLITLALILLISGYLFTVLILIAAIVIFTAKNKFGVTTCLLIFFALIALTVNFLVATDKDLLTVAVVLVTTAAITYQSHQTTLIKKRDNSKFYLEKYIQASDMILERLKLDNPTRRMAWISAASISEKIKALEQKITEESDKIFLEIYQRNLADVINEFISEKSSEYFYGVDEATNLDDAFNKCGFGQIITVTGLTPNIPKLTYVDEKSIEKIMGLTKEIWEKEEGYTYNDNREFLNVMKHNYPKLYEFLIHLRNKIEI